MEQFTDKEKELLDRLKKAASKDSKFCLTLTIDDEILTTREFSASSFSKESIVSTRTHFMMNDVIRLILKHYEESEKIFQEEKKKREMNKLWDEKNKEQ